MDRETIRKYRDKAMMGDMSASEAADMIEDLCRELLRRDMPDHIKRLQKATEYAKAVTKDSANSLRERLNNRVQISHEDAKQFISELLEMCNNRGMNKATIAGIEIKHKNLHRPSNTKGPRVLAPLVYQILHFIEMESTYGEFIYKDSNDESTS